VQARGRDAMCCRWQPSTRKAYFQARRGRRDRALHAGR
jgi:hypothetical protein